MMFGDLATLNGLKRNKHVLKYIIWDIKPKQLMEPRHRITEEGKQVSKIISGYLFYIDKMAGKKPTLFLMCHTTGGYAETLCSPSCGKPNFKSPARDNSFTITDFFN